MKRHLLSICSIIFEQKLLRGIFLKILKKLKPFFFILELIKILVGINLILRKKI